MKLKAPIGSALVTLFCVGLLLLSGCTTAPDATKGTATSPSEGNLPTANLPYLTGKATVELVVKGSPIVIEVDGDNAPITAGNFVDLVQRGVYDGLMFHRVVRQPSPFVVQGGDPQSANPDVPVAQLGLISSGI
jgi:peptidyl-prolyl cis-trans isomerase B (cyclophilin B)